MPSFFDSRRNRLHLGDLLGSGGEGDVFVVSGLNNQVAKIYKKPIEKRKADKLTWMASHGSRDLFRFSAWVLDTIHSQSGDIVGFLMPRVGDYPIHQLYSPQSRKKIFPDATWPFLLRVAENLATCFQAVHSVGQVIGDINHANCFVKADGTVALIDCDSFSIRADGVVFETEVVTSTYLPPELQCRAIKDVRRTQDHDNFGLAVLIFQLLFLGRHPFIGRPLGNFDSSLEEDIRARRFAYGKDSASRGMEPPPNTLDLEVASTSVAILFRTAFLSDQMRPKAEEWRKALQGLQANLKRCLVSRAHHHHSNLESCPWCALERVVKKPIFDVKATRPSTGSLDLVAIEKKIASLKLSSNPQNPLSDISIPPTSSEANAVLFAIIIFMTAFAGTAWYGIHHFNLEAINHVYSGILSCLVSLVFWVWLGNPKAEAEVAFDELTVARTTFQDIQERWATASDTRRFAQEKSRVEGLIHQYRKLEADVRERRQRLERDKRENQMKEYLEKFDIENAVEKGEIPKIGPGRLQALLSFGIETAADVDSSAILQIPGFGSTFTQNLMAWRTRREREFVFDPNESTSFADHQGFFDERLTKAVRLVLEIRRGVQELEQLVQTHDSQLEKLQKEGSELKLRTEKAKSVLEKTGVQRFSPVPLIMVSILIPIILSILRTVLGY